jgi:hypothetical protein
MSRKISLNALSLSQLSSSLGFRYKAFTRCGNAIRWHCFFCWLTTTHLNTLNSDWRLVGFDPRDPLSRHFWK